MNMYFLTAAILALLLGLIHSVIGEALIFRHWRNGRNAQKIQDTIPVRHRRIIWASWHIVTIFGWSFAAILFYLPTLKMQGVETACIEMIITISMLVSAILVLVGTRGKHPGWVVMLIISALIWLG